MQSCFVLICGTMVSLNATHYASVIKIFFDLALFTISVYNLWNHKYDGKKGIIPMKMDGCEAQILKEMGVEPDLLYIDASHHYDGVMKDVSTAIDLFPSAHIVGDDWEYPDVQRAVKDCAQNMVFHS